MSKPQGMEPGRSKGGYFFALAIALFAALLIAWGFLTRHLPVRLFDSETWKTSQSVDGIRVEMIDHLVLSGKLDGVSQKDVISMLGPASEPTHFSDWDAVYYLGRERGFMGIDSEWLVIDFDDNGFVKNYEVVRD